MSQQERPDAERPDGVKGEGDHEAGRRYDEATRRFVESGRVGPAADAARTDDPSELADLERAEQAGRSRAKEEDPSARPGADEPGAGRPGGAGRMGGAGG